MKYSKNETAVLEDLFEDLESEILLSTAEFYKNGGNQ